jgi:hypothetical protein
LKRYIGLVVLAVATALAACGQADASAVDDRRTDLRHTTSEAGLLADGAAAGRLPSPYVAAHASQLAEDADGVESALAPSSVAPDARPRADRVGHVAGLVAAALRRLRESPGDRAAASAVAAELRAAGQVLDAT